MSARTRRWAWLLLGAGVGLLVGVALPWMAQHPGLTVQLGLVGAAGVLAAMVSMGWGYGGGSSLIEWRDGDE